MTRSTTPLEDVSFIASCLVGRALHTRSGAPAADLQVSAEVAGEAQRLVEVEHLEPARANRRQRQLEAPPPGPARLEGEVDAPAAWLGCATRADSEEAALEVDGVGESQPRLGRRGADRLRRAHAGQPEEAVGRESEQLRLGGPHDVPGALQQRRRGGVGRGVELRQLLHRR
eukprot:CAMPEP_0118817720 /NCGR_PEP_ID=MMETSP1162-20130426/5575_1 /TAXON_ID=33656 /ORGANISM="Phaeocystis Sp, Strain CCMP2710" /LENGTH=171 /DNA_ID=CAMNT_0006747835 /DNA_START=16 /DNA_END=528 /DNA_ORIENTATION=-